MLFALTVPNFGTLILAFAQNLKQKRLKFLIHLIDYIDQQDASPIAEQSAKQWTLCEECEGV